MTTAILHKRKPLSDETKRKISEAKRGVLKTPEQRERMSKSKKGKLKSLAHKKNISLGMKQMWDEKRKQKLLEENKDTVNMYVFHKELDTMSTTAKSLEKFKRCGIEPANDFEDKDGKVWVVEYDSASPSGRTWEILDQRD